MEMMKNRDWHKVFTAIMKKRVQAPLQRSVASPHFFKIPHGKTVPVGLLKNLRQNSYG